MGSEMCIRDSHYLSGKVIKLKDPQIVKQFDGLDKSRQEAVDVS